MYDSVDIGTLRARFRAAYGAYQLHAARIAEQLKRGECPPIELLAAQERAVHALGEVRRELLDSLFQTLVVRMDQLTRIGVLGAAVQRAGIGKFYTLRVLQRWQRGEIDTQAAADLLNAEADREAEPQ